jgi:HD-like signal output (HDOD) protein
MPVVQDAPGARGSRPTSASELRRFDAGRERFHRHVMAVDRLPAAPEVATRTLALLERESCSLADLAAFIASDQAIAAGLLRLANSAFFARHGHITSLSQAVSRLGFAVWESFDDNPARRYALWLHSALVAGVAKRLAERLGRDGGEAFTGGVVHDVGKLVLGLRLGEEYWALVDQCAGETALAAAEVKEYGCHHGIVGGWLFEVWRLPHGLIETATLHHVRPARGARLDESRLVGLADRLVEATDPTSGAVADDAFREVQTVAPGLVTREQWADLYARVAGEQQAAASIFG